MNSLLTVATPARSSEAFLSGEGDGHVLVTVLSLVLVLGPKLALVLGFWLVLGRNLVSCLLEGPSLGLEGQEEKGSEENGWRFTCGLSEAFLSGEGDGHVLVTVLSQVLVLSQKLTLVLGFWLVQGQNLVSSLLEGPSLGLEGQEEKDSEESKGPHG
ncbi:hypothetical protein QTO34_016437 [Cnephaeus nilssonii]|uniref:Uncharacterized protein n=1 Tax=Cnephaeus nilssonii TaxID=3371016 RepID=A0AA40I2C4_CNENI|nr:hypothetical protein QTO34_016437 [Eptesicus nilssonii]